MTLVRCGHSQRWSVSVYSCACLCAVTIALLISISSARSEGVVVALDGSRSMWGVVGGTPKYMMVHGAFANALASPERAPDHTFGLVAFGNRSPSSCSDINVLVRPDAGDPGAFLDAIKGIRPWGMTPISRVLQTAANQVPDGSPERNILLITDGIDNCRGDPCSIAAALHANDRPAIIDVIALDVPQQDSARLACIAENSTGTFHNVTTRAELDGALAEILNALAERAEARVPAVSSAQLTEPATRRETVALHLPPRGHDPARTSTSRPLPIYARPDIVVPLPQDHPQALIRRMASMLPPEKPALETAGELVRTATVEEDPQTAEIQDPVQAATTEPSVRETEAPSAGPEAGTPGEPGAEATALVASVREPQIQASPELTGDPITTGSIPEADTPIASAIPDPAAAPAQPPAGQPPASQDTASRQAEPDNTPPRSGAAPELDIESGEAEEQQGLTLRAQLTANLRPITRPVQWRVFAVQGADEALWPQVAAVRDASPTFVLPPGAYQVRVGYGHVTAVKQLTVRENSVTDATFILNAGGLRILSHLVFVDAPGQPAATHFVYTGARDENGMRQLITKSQIQGEIIRLNAGTYHLVSRLGNANSVVETDVEVDPGVLTAVEVNHKAGVVSFAVSGIQNDAADPVVTQILDETGAVVARIRGLNGHAILAPGDYTAKVDAAGRRGATQFQVRTGEAKAIDLTVQ